MFKLFKKLKPFAFTILVVLLLVFIQSIADLQLPNFMSDIVNKGISAGGIERETPDALRRESYLKYQKYMTAHEQQVVNDSFLLTDTTLSGQEYANYVKKYPILKTQPIYIRKNISKDTLAQLDDIFSRVFLIDTMKKQISKQIPATVKPTPETYIKNIPDSAKWSIAVTALKKEYKAVGIPDRSTPYILRIGVLMLLVTLLGAICTIAVSFLSSKIAMRYGNRLREDMFTKVTGFSLAEFDKVGTATMITRTTNDITQIQQVIIMMLRMVVSAPMMLIGGVIMAFDKDRALTGQILIVIPLIAFLVWLMMSKGMPLFHLMQKKVDRLNLVLRESLTGVRVIRAFNRVGHDMERFDEANSGITDTAVRVNQLMAFLMPSLMLIMNLAALAIMYLGAVRVNAGSLEIGNLIAVSQYVMQIMFSLVMMSMMFIMLPRATVSADRINELMEIEPTIIDPKEIIRYDTKSGNVEFNNVTFRYAGAEQPAISNITFSAKRGETTAIIGGTGSGKSTIINLIPRFYDVTEGSISVDGVDLRKYSQHELRDKIALIPQKAILFSGTIRENLLFGSKDASESEMRRACEVSQAADFIESLPEKYEHDLSQGATNLSGGQKQRLTIARALLKRAEIYLFDDNFSALDFKTDYLLRNALKDEIYGATVIIVAQRVNTVMDADQIIVLDNGEIVGMGKHRELMESCDVYREVVYSQLSKEELG